jgi:hypothetical protein
MRLPAYTQYPREDNSVQETRYTGATRTSPDLCSEYGFMGRLLRGDHPKQELLLRKTFRRLAPREGFAESMHQTNGFWSSTYIANQSRSTA